MNASVCMYICMYTKFMMNIHESLKRALELLELELQAVVSHVGAGN